MNNHQKKKGFNRRVFLRTGVAAGAGLVLAPTVFAGSGNNRSDDINVALIGAGAQGRVLLEACIKIPNLRFKAVCDIWENYNLRNQTRFLKAYRHEPNSYLDYQEMLDKEKDKLDAVIIATPDFRHAEQTIACLKAGLHVYCEKEMSNTIEGARQMVRAAGETGKLLQIGHQRRSNPRYLHCFDKILGQARMLGRVTTVNGQWNRSAQPDLAVPEKYAIDQTSLEKYGFESMHQFLNWRWYKGLGGGPIVDLGSHQIDIYNWFLQTRPASVIASGGTDYYDKNTHQWYDNVMAVFDYPTSAGNVRAFYQTICTNSAQGYFELFMGDQGSLYISESASRGAVYREQSAPAWDKWVKAGIVLEPLVEKKKEETEAVLDVRETVAPPAYDLPIKMEKKYHQPHLENFFDAVRGRAKLSCPAEVGFESAVTVLKVNDAVEAGQKLNFTERDFEV